MKKLQIPTVDDINILNQMCSNTGVASQPYINNEHHIMHDKYIEYLNNNGNPWLCMGKVISTNLTDKLKYHYKKPFQLLNYINELRSKGSPDVCPFCGSSKTATLDHYLPQADYPEWIIFSKNLVPACDCNSKRRNDVKGNNNNQRVFHPYYDDCLTLRLVSASFRGNMDEPEIDFLPISNQTIPDETIMFHIDTVLKRSTAINWMSSKWQSMRRKPRCVISTIPRGNIVLTMQDLESYLLQCQEDKDDEHKTPNNWYSMFITGIINSTQAKQWLLDRQNGITQGTKSPLD